MESIHVPQNQSKKQIKKAIIFIHGLGGSRSSWTDTQNENKFIERFLKANEIKSNFSLYIFEYPTNIFSPFSFWKKILSLLPATGSKRKKRNQKFNVGIRKIALQLATDIREVLSEYDSISLIAHSMGGIVSKRALIELGDEATKVPLYISLSVPHRGSALATIGSKLLGNPQLVDLKGFSEFTSDLTNNYSNLKYKPKAIFQSGSQDKIVNEGSAIPAGVLRKDRIDTGDNHYTILQIDNPKSNAIFSRIIKELNIISNQISSNHLANVPVNFNIPENWTFQSILRELVETSKCTLEFIGFSDEELNIKLRPNEISKENTFQAIESLKFLGKTKIPNYEVVVEKSHFKIIKK